MKTSEFIQNMIELEKELDDIHWGEESKRLILRFTESMKYIDNGVGEIEGLLFLIEQVAMLNLLTAHFGQTFIIRFDKLMNCLPEEIDKYKREDEEERENIQKAEIVLRFANLLKKYDMEGWTDEIRAHFNCELEDLEDGLSEVERHKKSSA
jgi:hypothetical protein